MCDKVFIVPYFFVTFRHSVSRFAIVRSIEERDRRIEHLKQEIDSISADAVKERSVYRSKIDQLMEEREKEAARMRERHEEYVTRLQKDHDKECDRLNQIRAQSESQLLSIQQLHDSQKDLLKVWNESTDQMRQIQSLLVQKQEKGLQESVHEVRDREEHIRSLVQRLDSLCDIKQEFTSLAEDQRRLIENERKQVSQERKEWETRREKEMQELDERKESVRQDRETLERESGKLNLVKQEIWKEKDAVNREKQELEQQRLDVEQRISRLQHLEVEKQTVATSQILLDQEKGKLLELAEQVRSRAEELEVLTSLAAREREDGLTARSRGEELLKQAEEKDRVIQEKLETVEEKERLVKDQLRLLEQEKLAIKEMKDRVLCSLCNSGLQSYPRGVMMEPSEPLPLLIWQSAGEKDAAFLAREAEFIRGLRAGDRMSGI